MKAEMKERKNTFNIMERIQDSRMGLGGTPKHSSENSEINDIHDLLT